jgi:hypothetical protein
MKNYSLLMKLVCCAPVVCCTFGLMHSPLYAQGRSLNAAQLDAIVKPSLSQCEPPVGTTKFGRVDPNSIIPTNNIREFPRDRIAKTLHGIWRGQVVGDPNDPKYDKHKEGNVDYFWIMNTKTNVGVIIAQRGTGKQSTADLKPVAAVAANVPKISYLICPHEGYLPAMERGSEIHEFVKVSDSVDDAPRIFAKATGLKFLKAKPTLTDMWQQIVASGYFRSLPAVAFAGALFNIQLKLVPSTIGPGQVSLGWNTEYYGGGTTWLKFTPGVPMKGFEYGQFVGTTASTGDFLVASPGNGKLWKVEAKSGGDYDLAFDSVSVGPLQR